MQITMPISCLRGNIQQKVVEKLLLEEGRILEACLFPVGME